MSFIRTALAAILFAVVALEVTGVTQPVFTGTEIFPPEEFVARRAKVLADIGDGVAILQGTTERPGEQPLRQNNQFFYLTGVVEPRAIAVIDGRTRKTTIFLQPFSERREKRMYGPGLHPGEDAAKSLGVDAVLPRDEFAKMLPRHRARRPRRLHAVQARGAWRGVLERSARARQPHEKRSMGRTALSRRTIRAETEDGCVRNGGQGSRPDTGSSARHQKSPRNRGDPRRHQDDRAGDHGSDARREARHVRVRVAG